MNASARKLELLAPAKDLANGKIAISYGADAVYIGADRFSARSQAHNSLKDIEQLITFAHLYHARVYIALNTLLTDIELEIAANRIHQLYELGADAVIIQDIGLLEMNLPPIPLFASTQMQNDSISQIQLLETLGFQRVILARELDLAQIQTIRDATAIELEVFVHGSLCVSNSGNCYLSDAIGNRSANRGECAQPCRKKYALVDHQNHQLVDSKCLLSLKDLNLLARLAELVQVGVTSFKIEGRLKDASYVQNVVWAYRQRLDAILSGHQFLSKASSGSVTTSFKSDLTKTFNRGYTEYVIAGRSVDWASWDTPKWIGESIGVIQLVDFKGWIEIVYNNSVIELHNGDGLCFWDAEQAEMVGANVNFVENNRIYLQNINNLRVGMSVYRNWDHAFHKRLQVARVDRKILIDLVLTYQNDRLQLSVTDEDGMCASVEVLIVFQIAKQPEQVQAEITLALQKWGNTIFQPKDILLQIPLNLFIPIKLINALRREVGELLIQKRKQQMPPDYRPPNNQAKWKCPNNQDVFLKKLVLNQKSKELYQRLGFRTEPAYETGRSLAHQTVMTTKYCIRYQLGLCHRIAEESAFESLYLVDDHGKRYLLEFDCQNCWMRVVA